MTLAHLLSLKAMPTSKRTHEEHCLHICLCCLRKVKCHEGDKKDGVLIKDELKGLICEYVYPKFHENEDVLPKVLCHTCRVSLKSQKTPKPRKLPPKVNFENLVPDIKKCFTKTTRSGDFSLLCEVCKRGGATIQPNGSKDIPSDFLLEKPCSVGKPPNPEVRKPSISTLASNSTHQQVNKSEKLQQIVDNYSPGGKFLFFSFQ